MPKKQLERQCKDCQHTFPYIPRRIRCVDCYKKYTNFTKPVQDVKFIDDD